MYKIFLIVILLSGCAATENKPLTQKAKNSLGHIGVVSTIGDSLLCNYTGITIFTNEKELYKIPHNFNDSLATEISSQLSNINYKTTTLSRDSISFIDNKKRAQAFKNLKLNTSKLDISIDTLIVLDGSFHYTATGGYNARYNALHTIANLYIYDITSGTVLGHSTKYLKDLQGGFNCEQETLRPKSAMFRLVNRAGFYAQKKLVNNLFEIENSKSAKL